MADYTTRGYYLCWTLFDWTDEQLEILRTLVPDKASYCVFGRETCPKTNKRHLQGYTEFTQTVRITKLRKVLGVAKGQQSFHAEKRAGTAKEASEYCMKENEYEEFGELSGPGRGQGKRSDLLAVKEMLDQGKTVKDISDAYFGQFVRYHKSFFLYKQLHVPERDRTSISIVLYGASNAGKTWLTQNVFPGAYYVKKGNCGVWWEDYDQQPVVVFDEFTGWMQFTQFKTLVDSTPHTVDAKGGYRKFNSPIIVFCSNDHPDEWWSNDVVRTDNDRTALNRRIHFLFQAKEVKEAFTDNIIGYTCVVKKSSLPWNPFVADDWAIPGLTHQESVTAVTRGTSPASMDLLNKKSDIKLLTKSDGVILSPSLFDKSLDFCKAVEQVLRQCLLGVEGAPVVLPDAPVEPRTLEEADELLQQELLPEREGVEYYDNDSPMLPLTPKPKAKAIYGGQSYKKVKMVSKKKKKESGGALATRKRVNAGVKVKNKRVKCVFVSDEASESSSSDDS